MNNIDLLSIVSLVASLFSIALAVLTFYQASLSEKRLNQILLQIQNHVNNMGADTAVIKEIVKENQLNHIGLIRAANEETSKIIESLLKERKTK